MKGVDLTLETPVPAAFLSQIHKEILAVTEVKQPDVKVVQIIDQVADDRRRPGRLRTVNPDLIPLLRDAGHDDALAGNDQSVPYERYQDDLAPARGILFGLLLSAPFWIALVGLLLWARR